MEWINGKIQTIINYFKSVWDAFQRLFDWFGEAYDAFIEFFKQLPEWVFSELIDGFIEFFNAIPVPDFFAIAASAFGGIPPEVIYFAEPFRIGYGVSMILGAYLLRFIVRRIPIFG